MQLLNKYDFGMRETGDEWYGRAVRTGYA
jgi:hypothetical protein